MVRLLLTIAGNAILCDFCMLLSVAELDQSKAQIRLLTSELHPAGYRLIHTSLHLEKSALGHTVLNKPMLSVGSTLWDVSEMSLQYTFFET